MKRKAVTVFEFIERCTRYQKNAGELAVQCAQILCEGECELSEVDALMSNAHSERFLRAGPQLLAESETPSADLLLFGKLLCTAMHQVVAQVPAPDEKVH